MDRFPKFNMVISAPPQLTMWHNDLDGDHRRTLNKYVGALTELINMDGWPELIEVLTGYWIDKEWSSILERPKSPLH